ncbi:MAG: tetratricopeptide repeat protein [Bacteroidetes bacterium]|nr:tetratricopeptide repeat protein [Bacteroidota bacterium]
MELLRESSPETDLNYHLQLLTQIARTHSLRRNFAEAHQQLDEVEKLLPAPPITAYVRYHLERGRTFNSAGDKQEASAHFEKAESIAQALQEDFYRVDALHMMAIASPAVDSMKLNERAIQVAEASKDERTKNWLGSLYNNLGWSYFDLGNYEQALRIFLRALQWRESKNQAAETFLAKWCVARTLRAMGKIEEAIKIQLALLEEVIESENADGYVYEELAELHLLKKDDTCKMYFQFAYNELSKDAWLTTHEPQRIERLKQLAS